MLSYWPCQRLNVAAAACSSSTFGTGAHPGPQIGFHCFLFLLVGVVLNRGL